MSRGDVSLSAGTSGCFPVWLQWNTKGTRFLRAAYKALPLTRVQLIPRCQNLSFFICPSEVVQVLSARAGDQSISNGGRGNSAGGLGQSRNEKTSPFSLLAGLPEALWASPFLFPRLGQQWSGAQVLMGPSGGQGIPKHQKHVPLPTGDGKCLE